MREKRKNRTRFDLWNKSNKKEACPLKDVAPSLDVGGRCFFLERGCPNSAPPRKKEKDVFLNVGGQERILYLCGGSL